MVHLNAVESTEGDSFILRTNAPNGSYAQKLVMASLGGSLKLFDPVLESNPLNDLRHTVGTIKFSPF